MPFIESFEEFTKRQDCEHIRVGNRYLFRNGAQSDGHTHYDPPSGDQQLLKLRYEYLQAKLSDTKKLYKNDYEAIKTQLEYHRLGAGPMPASGWEEHLQKLASKIECLQAAAEKVQKELETTALQTAYVDRRNEQKQAAAEGLAALRALPTY